LEVDISTSKQIFRLKLPEDVEPEDRVIRSLAFNPDGSLIAAAGPQNIFLWDFKQGQMLRVLGSTTHRQSFSLLYSGCHLIFSPESSFLASNFIGDSPINVWDIRALTSEDDASTGMRRVKSKQPQGYSALALSFNGQFLAGSTYK
jgi:WD40 repeat protein